MLYTVSEMAKRLGVAPSTLRYYDKEGLLPFVERSGGSGISSYVSAIKNACPNADVKDGFRGTSSTSSDDIKNWLNSVGF